MNNKTPKEKTIKEFNGWTLYTDDTVETFYTKKICSNCKEQLIIYYENKDGEVLCDLCLFNKVLDIAVKETSKEIIAIIKKLKSYDPLLIKELIKEIKQKFIKEVKK